MGITIRGRIMDNKTRINLEESIIITEFALYSDKEPGDFLNIKKIVEAKLDKIDFGYLLTVSDEFRTLRFRVDSSFIIETQKLIYTITSKHVIDYSLESAKCNIDLSIISGKYFGCKAILFLDQQLIKVYTNHFSPNENDRNIKEIIIALDEVSQVSITSNKKDNSIDIGCLVGMIAWVLIGLYNASLAIHSGGDPIIEFLTSIVSGFIYGGIAFLIAKLFKQEQKVIKLETDNSVLEIKFSDEVFDYISKYNRERKLENTEMESGISVFSDEFSGDLGSESDGNALVNHTTKVRKINTSSTQSTYSDYYDELIKLKELLDKNIISESEFQKLKNRIIGD
jgi:hypothetical protein